VRLDSWRKRPAPATRNIIWRTLFALIELPVGLVTAVIGAPFFLYLLWRQRGAPLPRR